MLDFIKGMATIVIGLLASFAIPTAVFAMIESSNDLVHAMGIILLTIVAAASVIFFVSLGKVLKK